MPMSIKKTQKKRSGKHLNFRKIPGDKIAFPLTQFAWHSIILDEVYRKVYRPKKGIYIHEKNNAWQ